MNKIVTPILLLLLGVMFAYGDDAVSVKNVTFNTTRDDWLQMEIELECAGKQSTGAENPRYVENVKVKAYVVFTVDQRASQFDFYTAEVEIPILKQGDDANVYFYVPGLIMERDKWSNKPDYYFVELMIDGVAQPTQRRGISSDLTSETVLNSMKSRADAESEENKDLLMPIYFTPAEFRGRVSKVPTFVRRQPAE